MCRLPCALCVLGGVTQNPLFPQQQKHSNTGDVSIQGRPVELSTQLGAGHIRAKSPQGKQTNSPGAVLSGIGSLISILESNPPPFSGILWQRLPVAPQYQLVVDSEHRKSQVPRCQQRADLASKPCCVNSSAREWSTFT